jgi:hypothetical protein
MSRSQDYIKLIGWNIALMTAITLFTSCVSLRPVSVSVQDSVQKYRYIYITPTQTLSSGSGTFVGNQYYSSSKTINPADVVSGILTKQGFIRLPELRQELTNQTLIVNFGESGKRNAGLGYTLEVTIQFINAQTLQPVCTCTAEGMGSTEADDIRNAIQRCLQGVLK